jgi:hypothetical protein
MNKGFVIVPLMIAAASLSTTVAADGLNYNYVEIGYVSASIDDSVFSVDGDGVGIAGSFSISDNFHIVASYADLDYDFDINEKSYDFGLGGNFSLGKNLDLVGAVTYVSAEVSQPFLGSFDDNGYGLYVGLRGLATEKIELFGGVDYLDLSDSGSTTTVSVGAGYNFTDNFQVGGGYSNNSDGNSYTIGIRFFFGE